MKLNFDPPRGSRRRRGSRRSSLARIGSAAGPKRGCTHHTAALQDMGDHGAEKDALVKDSKQLAHSGCSVVLPFCLALIVGVPLLCLFIVLALLWKLLTWPLKLCKAKAQPRPVPEPAPAADRPAEQLDLVLFGATGFTGNLAARYIAKTYGTKIKWGIAGRRRDALETLRAELAQTQPELKSELAILICDSSDLVQLADLVAKTKVVISTVGPFALYGSSLVAACAVAGTHYCDITGESDWVREMVDRYDDAARKSGAKIVHFCGTLLLPIAYLSMFPICSSYRARACTWRLVQATIVCLGIWLYRLSQRRSQKLEVGSSCALCVVTTTCVDLRLVEPSLLSSSHCRTVRSMLQPAVSMKLPASHSTRCFVSLRQGRRNPAVLPE